MRIPDLQEIYDVCEKHKADPKIIVAMMDLFGRFNRSMHSAKPYLEAMLEICDKCNETDFIGVDRSPKLKLIT